MTLSEIKNILLTMNKVTFKLENGEKIPDHFHITEIGLVSKNFIDCGGKIRTESLINFQLWNANDLEHRLKPSKLLNIIKLSERKLEIEDLEVEVEYQADTIGKYGLKFENNNFILTNKKTDCLAKDNCGIPKEQIPFNKPCSAENSDCC